MPPKMAASDTDIDQRIAAAVAAALAHHAQPAPTPAPMAELADKLWDARNSQSMSAVEADIAAVRPFSPSHQGRSPDRRQQRPKGRQATPHENRCNDSSWCRNHRRLGDKTRNCIPPCSYPAEN